MTVGAYRQVYVLASHYDDFGRDLIQGTVVTVPYATDQERADVNALVSRGVATFEVGQAQEYARQQMVEPRSQKKRY